MSIQETFEDIPHELTTNALRPRILNRDTAAMDLMWRLHQNLFRQPPGTYARGSWGYTILRTVYTPESDELLPSVLAKLERWMAQYHLHINRFPFWGELGEAEHKKMSNGSINDELGRRFRIELVQDEKKLNLPRLQHASQQDICSLCDVFDAWVAGVGQDPRAEYPLSPPVLRLPRDRRGLPTLARRDSGGAAQVTRCCRLGREEGNVHLGCHALWQGLHYCICSNFTFQQMRCCGDEFFWLLDTRAVRSFARNPDQPPNYRGWMKVEVDMIINSWFDKCSRLQRGDYILDCVQKNEDPNEYWYDNSVF
ncbi:hypothetical protein PG993_011000 [Apiospora rasikravindrae]|uniref:Uncharacterized protein n=1 Tax=Apiospora rasikravindrae TaxID=990691 RepID=A0ABR1SCZ6_9PEZI